MSAAGAGSAIRHGRDSRRMPRRAHCSTDRVHAQRYGALRTGTAKVRVAGGGATSTRFCPTTGTTRTSTCEVTGAFGPDTLFGDEGQDVLLGDRGGIRDRYETGSRSTTTSLTMPPAVTLTTRLSGSVSREVDLLHDVNGTDLVGGPTSTPMPLDGITYGGADRIRGGDGHDSIHAGASDESTATPAVTRSSVTAAPTSCGAAPDGPAPPRMPCASPTPGPPVSSSTTWSEARTPTFSTVHAGEQPAPPGVDWVHGGWDRDVMQGDLSNNGPNNGDRLIDWNGVDNPWSHCNAAYGGFTDVRAPAPAVQDFLEKWGTGNGAGSTRHRGRRSRHGDRRDVCVRRAGPGLHR